MSTGTAWASKGSHPHRAARGFTLIELMIVVVVVAILASVAYPSYVDSVRKGVRRAAQAQMMELSTRQQQFLLANRSYATYDALVASGYALPADLAGKYTPSVTLGTGAMPTFTITFRAEGAQAPDGDLSLTSEGVKAPAGKW